MKMIIFLVLAGLSLAAGKTDPGNGWGCLNDALTTAAPALQAVSNLICNYTGTFDGNVKNYEAAFNTWKATMENIGCKVDEMLGTDETIKDIAGSVTDVAAHAGRVALKLTDELDITPDLTDVLCELFSGALTSPCLANILAHLTPQLLDDIYELSCENDINALSADTIFELLINIACFLDDTAGTKDALEVLVDKFGESLAPALQNVLQGLAAGIVAAKGSLVVAGPLTDLTSDLICFVLNLLENKGVLGGLGGLTGGL